MPPLLLFLKKVLLDVFSPSLQSLDINSVATSNSGTDRAHPSDTTIPAADPQDCCCPPDRPPLTPTPKNRPGEVVLLPEKCGACGSYLIGYDELNVITCDSCDSLLSVSGHWHKPYGQIDLSKEEIERQQIVRRTFRESA
jgi:hypothetical protein